MRARSSIVILCEQPAGPWPHAEHFEKVSTDELAGNAFRLIAIADVHLRAAPRDHSREDKVLIAQILVHRIRERAVVLWTIFRLVRGEHCELFCICNGQTLQQDSVEEREDGGVRADS